MPRLFSPRVAALAAMALLIINIQRGSCNGLVEHPVGAASVVYLDGQWTANLVSTTQGAAQFAAGAPPILTLPNAQVPGDLITDLEMAGEIVDPLYELTFKNASWWHTPPESERQWVYSTSFATHDAAASSTAAADVTLVMDGVKMGATVRLNGHTLGTVTDQFLRYNFTITDFLVVDGGTGSGNNTLEVAFDGTPTDGRYMACTGGWDWGPYSNTYEGPDHTFSKGIWKSVYVATTPRNGATILHLSPRTFYLGPHLSAPLASGVGALWKGQFLLQVKTLLRGGSDGSTGSLNLNVEWATKGPVNSTDVHLAPGEELEVELSTVVANSDGVDLWWPLGLSDGPRSLYSVSVDYNPASVADQETHIRDGVAVTNSAGTSASRRVGFRVVALVTGNDTDPEYVKAAAGKEGTDDHGLYFRVNGAAILSRGANVIPMDNMEGRYTAQAHAQLVASAAAAGMNFLRIWGGGVYLPPAFYDTADELGVLVYHDLMYTTTSQTHEPTGSEAEAMEIAHNLRALSHHPAIIVWNACNECDGSGLYTSFAMTKVAEVDESRPIWPACPSSGWGSGVRLLDALPTGTALSLRPNKSKIERHGPYANGNGFQAVNQAPTIPIGGDPFVRPLRLPVPINETAHGLSVPNMFTSEFGASVFPSFESIAPTLSNDHWSVHGGAAEDNCTAPDISNPFWKDCTEGNNVMAERNYPCDNLILGYFGASKSAYGGLDDVGEAAFQRQLWQCMISQALAMDSDISARRSTNAFGIVTWQLNEIWPTGGWGSLEYGTTGFTSGQVLGGRWRPLHHWMRQHLYADVFATCGADNLCFVKNDAPLRQFSGTVVVNAVSLQDGTTHRVASHTVKLPEGPGSTHWFSIGDNFTTLATDGNHVMNCSVTSDDGLTSISHVLLGLAPSSLKLHASNVTATVLPKRAVDIRSGDGIAIDVRVTGAPALYVTLTTLANGWFSDNAVVLLPGSTRVFFHPIGHADLPLLASSLRVEHMALYMPVTA